MPKWTGFCSDPRTNTRNVQPLSKRNRVFLASRHCPRLGPLEFCDSLIKTQAGQDCTPIPSGAKSDTVKLQARGLCLCISQSRLGGFQPVLPVFQKGGLTMTMPMTGVSGGERLNNDDSRSCSPLGSGGVEVSR